MFERTSAGAGGGRAACEPEGGPAPAKGACPVSSPHSLPFQAIVDHIEANLARRILVDELAAIASLSVFQLSRAFRREHETTPYRLVLDMRVRNALALLAGGASIADAALHAGFADQSHFTRHMKRLTGMTPKHYGACQRTGVPACTSSKTVAKPAARSRKRAPDMSAAP